MFWGRIGIAPIRFGLGELTLRLADLLQCGVGIGTRGFDRGVAGPGGGDGLIVLLLRYLLFVDKLSVPANIVLGFHVIGLSLLKLRLGRFRLLSRGLDAGARTVGLGLSG